MEKRSEIKEIIALSGIHQGKFWSRDDGDIHAPAGFSTIDVMNTLGEIGAKAKDHPAIQEAVDFLFQYQDTDGYFKYSPKSPKLPCITARVLSALGKLGYRNDPRMEKSFQCLLKSQKPDGGWRCSTVKPGKSAATDSSNPGTTLYALDAFRFRDNPPTGKKALEKAAMFLLKHWETKKPLGPCGFGIGSRFLSIEFPFLRYNLFYYVYILSKYRISLKDKRYRKALNTLIYRTQNDEIFPETPHTSWGQFSFAKKGEFSGIATERYLEILNAH
jgi:hypothetical protein